VRSRLVLAAVAATVAAAAAQTAGASPAMRVGIFDEAQTLYGPVQTTFPLLKQLHVQELRLNLYWGGRYAVARRRPANPADPGDPAYNWALYDRTVNYADQYGVKVLFSIYGTPSWANGGRPANVPPTFGIDLRNFAYAAARRYSGTYPGADGRPLPAVRDWLAWNEPNNPVFLTPQYQRVGGVWVMESAIQYAKICNAIYAGIHAAQVTGERVACGGTAPRGNNQPGSARASTSPIAFLRAVKQAGLLTFDAWAHNPYYGSPDEQPASKPVTPNGAPPTAVTLGNIGSLISAVTALYGWKPIWITEYGYQTNPPDPVFGVSLAKQALYLREAFGIARANPRIQLMLWFLLVDEPNLSGWQSGLITASGKKKPSFAAFASMAAAAGAAPRR
jgi:hypothetical protein